MADKIAYRMAFVEGPVTVDACWVANDPQVGGAEALLDITLPIPGSAAGDWSRTELMAQVASATDLALAWARERAIEAGILSR